MAVADLLLFPGWADPPYSYLLIGVIVLAGVGTGVLFLVGVIAYRRRRTRAYLYVTVALGLLVLRSAVGLGTVYGAVPMAVHHLIEHTVDFAIAVLLLVAIYTQRTERES